MKENTYFRTVPVKIRKTQNNLRNRHEDANFFFTTKQYMKNIGSLFGAENVFVLSADDKENVPIGLMLEQDNLLYLRMLIMKFVYLTMTLLRLQNKS